MALVLVSHLEIEDWNVNAFLHHVFLDRRLDTFALLLQHKILKNSDSGATPADGASAGFVGAESVNDGIVGFGPVRRS